MSQTHTNYDLEIKKLSDSVAYLIKYTTTLATHRELRQAMTVINQEFAKLAGQVTLLQSAVNDGGLPRYSDNEIPTGTKDGVNPVFHLAHDPHPSASLQLFVDGTLLENGNDYTTDHEVLTITNAAYIPSSGTPFVSFYKY